MVFTPHLSRLDSADRFNLYVSSPGVQSSRRSYDQPVELPAITFGCETGPYDPRTMKPYEAILEDFTHPAA